MEAERLKHMAAAFRIARFAEKKEWQAFLKD